MVKEYAKLNDLYKIFQQDFLQGKRRFTLEEFEDYLINKLDGVSNYEKAGGYQGLYKLIKEKEDNKKVVAIKSSASNNRQPPLKKRWQIIKIRKAGWPEELIFKLSRKLDLSYYLKRPHLQTKELAAKLKRINRFLLNKEKREWASREERSLELFADEKLLTKSKGKKLLSRLKLSLADIKAEKYSQMFVFWQKDSGLIKKILILENHAAFIACKRALERDYSIFSYNPDTLIYGGGKHIIDSLKFLEEIANPEQVKIKYAGDIDPEGLAIYTALKDKYSLSIFLHLAYYKEMIDNVRDCFPLQSKQQKKQSVLDNIIKEFKANNYPQVAKKITELWQTKRRIPQEVISYEVLKEYNSVR